MNEQASEIVKVLKLGPLASKHFCYANDDLWNFFVDLRSCSETTSTRRSGSDNVNVTYSKLLSLVHGLWSLQFLGFCLANVFTFGMWPKTFQGQQQHLVFLDDTLRDPLLPNGQCRERMRQFSEDKKDLPKNPLMKQL